MGGHSHSGAPGDSDWLPGRVSLRARRGRLAAVAFVALAVSGCASTPPPPSRPGSLLTPDAAHALLARWHDDWEAFDGLRAQITLHLTRNGRTQRSSGALLLSRSRLRLELFGPLSLPVAVATAGPDGILVVSLTERRAWVARPTTDAVRRWLGVPLSVPTLIRLLAGSVPGPADPGSVEVLSGPDPHLAFDRDGLRHRVWIAADASIRVRLEGEEPLSVTLTRTGSGLPAQLTIELGARDQRVELRYVTAEAGRPAAETFELRVPADIPIERLD